MADTDVLNGLTPRWGSRSWRYCAILLAILLGMYGTFSAISGLVSGYPFWWYNITFIVFAFGILGLALLVMEVINAFNNIQKYGFRPSLKQEKGTEPESNPTTFNGDNKINE